MRVVLGQTVVGFRPTRDAGRDLAYEGEWNPQGGEALSGKFVVQCKFKATGNFYRSDLTPELAKIRKLVARGRCDTYVLMTNAGLTASTEDDLRDDLSAAGVKHSFVVGGDLLDQYLREKPELRAHVPRLYGLGDLTQILDERRYAQAAALLASLREDIAKFVITKPYERAIRTVIGHSLVLLIGAPAAGKSMIAAALAAASIDMWGCRPIRVESANGFVSAWNPHDHDQFFWIDDAFGATQYQPQKADEWNQALSHLRAAVNGGTRVVMTSRDYVWHEAAQDLKLGVLPGLVSGQVVVDVHDLDLDDKRQILYNHLKYGAQPTAFRTSVKPFLESAAHVDEFLPEVARRFGDPQFTAKVEPQLRSVVSFFERPVEHLEEVVRGLGADEFASLALIFMARGLRQSPIELSDVEGAAVARLGSDIAGVVAGLMSLRGSLIVLASDPELAGRSVWSFKHPTIGEAVRRHLSRNPENLGIYLVGSSLDSLISEITCGDVGRTGALVVPESGFAVVASRLAEASRDFSDQTKVANFLVTRCSPDFLARHGSSLRALDVDPDEPGSLRIAARLHALGLLAEPVRLSIVAYYERIAVDWLDLRILTDQDLAGLVQPNELERVTERLRDEVIVNLDSYIEIEKDNFDGSEAPDDVARRLRRGLETLLIAFPNNDEVERRIEEAGERIDSLEISLAENWHGDYEPDDGDWRDRSSDGSSSDPGVFADVDE